MDLIPALQPGALLVVCGPHAVREDAAALAARLALRGPLTVLDAGNRFQPYRVTRLLRAATTDVRAAAGRLHVRRAFTCYQVAALLEGTPALPQPYLVLDLLASFYDEQVSPGEARRLLDGCLRELARLARLAPVAVTLAPPAAAGRAGLIEQVCAQAARVLTPLPPPALPTQPALW